MPLQRKSAQAIALLTALLASAGCRGPSSQLPAESQLGPTMSFQGGTTVAPTASYAGVSTVPLSSTAPAPSADVSDDTEPPTAEPEAVPLYRHELPAMPADAPANIFANLSAGDCKKRIADGELPMIRHKSGMKGVATAYRVGESIHGVKIRTHPAPSPYGVLDCRLALLLDPFTQLLTEHDVVEMRVDNMYRPNAKLPGKKTKSSQHAHGLAFDIMTLTLSDGTTLSVEDDWHAPIGAEVCGPDAVLTDPTDKAVRLRNIVCDAAARGLFHHMLTPSFDAAHRNHFHFDIKRDANRRSVR